MIFTKVTLPSGPCGGDSIQVQVLLSAPLSSLEIKVPGLFFCLKKDSNRPQTTLIFASKLCIMQFGGENYDFDDFNVAGSIAKIQ